MMRQIATTVLAISLLSTGPVFAQDKAPSQTAKTTDAQAMGRDRHAAAQEEAYNLRKQLGVMNNTSPAERKAAASRLKASRDAAAKADTSTTPPSGSEVTK
jgi:hypothetical protein